jgi:hypothetical protein
MVEAPRVARDDKNQQDDKNQSFAKPVRTVISNRSAPHPMNQFQNNKAL